MKKLLLLLYLIISAYVSGHTVPIYNLVSKVTTEKNEPVPIQCEITKGTDSYSVKIGIEEVAIEEDQLYTGRYFLKIPGFGLTKSTSLPALPFRKETFSVPAGKSPVIQITKCKFTELNLCIAPARPDLPQTPDARYTRDNVPVIKPYAGYFPNICATVGEAFLYRGIKLWDIEITPVAYSIEKNSVKICKELEFTVTFEDSDSVDPCEPSLCMSASGSNKLFHITEDAVETTSLEPPYPNTLYVPRDLLIVTVPELEDVANTFAEWKRKDGYTCTIFSDENWTTFGLRSDIMDFASTHSNFEAVVIIGDIDAVPAFRTVTVNNTYYYSDCKYACLDSMTDLYPDVQYGRIPLSSPEDAENCIKKIILYESGARDTRYVDNNTLRRIVLGSAFQPDTIHDKYREYTPFIVTSEKVLKALKNKSYAAERVYSLYGDNYPKLFYDGTSMPDYLLPPNFMWNNDANDVINSINCGVGCIFYNSHGVAKGWSRPEWYIQSLSRLTNKHWYPLIFNISCLTGKMDEDNFVKNILRSPYGAAGVFAATEVSLIDPNAPLYLSLVQELFPDTEILPNWSKPETNWGTVGEAIHNSLNYARSQDNIGENYQHNVYHWFGDPTMRLFTSLPTLIQNVGISFGASQIIVNAPGDDVKTTAVYSNGDVLSTYSDYTSFPAIGCESITLTGVNKVARTIHFNQGEEPEKSLLLSYLQSAICLNTELIVNYNIPTAFTSGTFNPGANKYGSIIISKADGTTMGTYRCSASNNQITIDMSTFAEGNYIVTLTYNGNNCGSTRIKYTYSHSRY